jgi:hypothetical protein
MKPLGILFFGIAAVLLGVGILFHYKEKNDYGEYFFFCGVCLFLGICFS